MTITSANADDSRGSQFDNFKLVDNFRKELRRGASVHDVFFRLIMTDVVFALDFFKAYLSPKISSHLNLDDPSLVKILPGEFFDPRLKKHVADLIFLLPLRQTEEEGVAYLPLTVIVEHKAQSSKKIDRKTLVQTLKYLALELEIQLNEVKENEVVYQPLVFLVYTGNDVNFEAPSWRELIPVPDVLKFLDEDEEFRGSHLDFRPYCVNLTRLFKEGKLVGDSFVRLAPELMARASLGTMTEACDVLFRPLNSIGIWTDRDRDLLAAYSTYVVETARKLTREQYEAILQSIENEKMRGDMDSLFDQAERRGKTEAVSGLLQNYCKLRFGLYPERLESSVKKLEDPISLEAICCRAFGASCLEEIESFAETKLSEYYSLERQK